MHTCSDNVTYSTAPIARDISSYSFFFHTRSPRCSVCGGFTRWNTGVARFAVSPHWHWDLSVSGAPQHRWEVRTSRTLTLLSEHISFWLPRKTSFVVKVHYTCVFKFMSLIGSYALSYSAVFTWTNLLVVVVELSGSEQEALDLVPLVTNVVLKEHHLIVGVVVIVDTGVIPINSRGEKQRMHLRDSFLADQLDPIYVAYNMWAWTNVLKALHGTQRTTHNKPFLCAVSTQHGGRSWLVLSAPALSLVHIYMFFLMWLWPVRPMAVTRLKPSNLLWTSRRVVLFF